MTRTCTPCTKLPRTIPRSHRPKRGSRTGRDGARAEPTLRSDSARSSVVGVHLPRPNGRSEARKRHALKRRSGVGEEGSGASAAPPRLRSACLSQLVKYSPSDNSCPALEASALNPSRRSLLELALILETQGTIQGWSAIKRGLW